MSKEPQDYALFLLRFTIAGLLLFHGIQKALNGVGGIQEMLVAQHLPSNIAYLVFVGEIVAPLMLIVGYLTRAAGGVIIFNMLVAIFLAYGADALTLKASGAPAIELPLFFILTSLVIIIGGPGELSVDERGWK